MKDIVLIGASGYVGSAILQEALDRGMKVTAAVRNPDKITETHPNLIVVKVDVSSKESVVDLCKGKDAVISAYNPGWTNPDIYEETLKNYPIIIEGVKEAGVNRLLIVGGAGTLYIAPGKRLIDSGQVPMDIQPGVKSLGMVYLNYLLPEKELDWVFLSPSASLFPGKRTGKFRIGKDDILVGPTGESSISVEDYAMAMIDELENPKHHRERFTVGY